MNGAKDNSAKRTAELKKAMAIDVKKDAPESAETWWRRLRKRLKFLLWFGH